MAFLVHFWYINNPETSPACKLYHYDEQYKLIDSYVESDDSRWPGTST